MSYRQNIISYKIITKLLRRLFGLHNKIAVQPQVDNINRIGIIPVIQTINEEEEGQYTDDLISLAVDHILSGRGSNFSFKLIQLMIRCNQDNKEIRQLIEARHLCNSRATARQSNYIAIKAIIGFMHKTIRQLPITNEHNQILKYLENIPPFQ